MATDLNTTLTIEDLAVLSQKLLPIASQWYILGVQLELKPGELRVIQQQAFFDPVQSLTGLLEKWLDRVDPPSTLEAIVKVVGGKVVANGKLSKKLQDECADFPSIRCKHPEISPISKHQTAVSTGASIEGSSGGEDFEDPDAPLGNGSHFDITEYLQPLATDRKQLIGLGQVLGLRYSRLRGIELSSLLEDIIEAWLRKEDEVMERCPPTWRNLANALRNQRIRQNGIADTIAKEKKILL